MTTTTAAAVAAECRAEAEASEIAAALEAATTDAMMRRWAEIQRSEAAAAGRGEAQQTEASASSRSEEAYPRVVDVECVCTAAGCGARFTVPLPFLAPDRPVGRTPALCPACSRLADKGERERAAALAREAQARAAKAREVDVLRAVELAGGNPHEYADAALDTFAARPGREKALSSVREWVAAVLETRDRYAKVRGLYLVGETGTGKTALAHAALKALLDAGLRPGADVIFDDALSLVERVRGTYGSDESTWKLLESRIAARVWILDDFMAERPTDDVVSKFTMLLNRREGRPTFVTSNFTPDALHERHQDAFRMLSRLGPAQFRLVRCRGVDARFQQEAR